MGVCPEATTSVMQSVADDRCMINDARVMYLIRIRTFCQYAFYRVQKIETIRGHKLISSSYNDCL